MSQLDKAPVCDNQFSCLRRCGAYLAMSQHVYLRKHLSNTLECLTQPSLLCSFVSGGFRRSYLQVVSLDSQPQGCLIIGGYSPLSLGKLSLSWQSTLAMWLTFGIKNEMSEVSVVGRLRVTTSVSTKLNVRDNLKYVYNKYSSRTRSSFKLKCSLHLRSGFVSTLRKRFSISVLHKAPTDLPWQKLILSPLQLPPAEQ
jgi:hypothetical protein